MNGLFCDRLAKIHEGKQGDAPTFIRAFDRYMSELEPNEFYP
jgi:hypothetical protein